MINLSNSKLSVNVLDPINDQVHLGSRYCHAGHIWQIEEKTMGPLLSGPSFPELHPNVFDGQGIPEVFETAPGYYPSKVSDEIMVIGVGKVLRSSSIEPFHTRNNNQILKHLDWTIKKSVHTLSISASQSLNGYSYALTKEIQLDSYNIHSITKIHNNGVNPLPIRWFAHPFFPINSDFTCCELSLPVRIPDNPAFTLVNNYIIMKKSYEWQKGYYRTIQIPWGQMVCATVAHPKVNGISLKPSFSPAWLPLWANANTFSIEPVKLKLLSPGSMDCWHISYEFRI